MAKPSSSSPSPLEHVLRNDTHFVEIVPAEEWPTLPSPDHFSNPALAQRFLRIIQDWLAWPYIIDGLPGHDERNQWKADIKKQYGPFVNEHLEQNALRQNPFNSVVNMALLLAETTNAPQTPSLQWAAQELEAKRAYVAEGHYAHRLATPQKLEFAKGLKQTIYTVVSLVAQQ